MSEQVAWTAQLIYAAAGLTDQDTATLTAALDGAEITYAAGRLHIQLDVDAPTLEQAATKALGAAAAATGLLKPHRLSILPTTEFVNLALEPMSLDLIGVTEIAAELGVSRQRAGKLADAPDFPPPVAHPASGRIYSRAAVKAFQRRWEATRNPLGGRPRRAAPPPKGPAPS